MRWWIAFLISLWVFPVGAQVDLSPEERRAAYCYGAAVEKDAGRRDQLYDYLESRGLGFHGHRPILARQLRDEISKVGARNFQICKISPGGAACLEVDSCQ
ncbi:hypothetical protein RSO01_25100 [Reyranella soli]|uniref:Uncharacterized protein n=1 Tax=Reyranella soli TaxID=1230389 RepID=A0A512N8N9_9HYPH|nr:hypothetical protein RSO01_25100 [Reyranella soli]